MTQATSRTRYPGPVPQAQVHAHDLVSRGFATDTALADILHRYPAGLMDINLYDYDADGQVSLRTGDKGDLTGEQLLAAIQGGRLWVNLRNAEAGCPDLWAATMKEFRRIEASYPGMHMVNASGQLIISSPVAKVPYHFDAAGVILFHLRGRKRLFVYPGDEDHLPEEAMEKVVARQTTEEIPYRLAFESDAQVVDLEPGQALTWPFYAPHRVENLDKFCVSLSVEFQTWSTRLRNGALYTNAVIRSRGGRPCPTEAMGAPELAARWVTSLALKRLGVLDDRIATIQREFTPDATVVDGARPLRA